MKNRNGILTGLIAVSVACVISAYIVDGVDAAIEFHVELPGVRYLIGDARAFVAFHTIHLGFAADPSPGSITSGRARSLVGGVLGLFSLVIGAVALAGSAGRTGKGRVGAIVALVLGLIGMILSVVHLGMSTGGFGSGSGRAGAIVALVLSLIGINLGGLALVRSRRSRSAG